MTNLRNAQIAYDNREPDYAADPLELTEVTNWIQSAAQTLLSGSDVMLRNRITTHSYELSDKVAAEAVRRYEEGEDQDGMLGQLILAALECDASKAHACALSFFGPDKDWCEQAAIELIEPHAADILEQIAEDNRYDYY